MSEKTTAAPKLDRAKKKPTDALHHAVLDTTELLECVLSHLPPKQIFGVHRVARLWKDVIACSPDIQEKLFLKLQNKPAEFWALLECARRAEFEGKLAYFFPDITEFCNRLAFDLNSSLLDTHISYPPCMRARIALSCYSSPERPDFYRLQACFVVQTDKPLISRDVIVETWTDSIWTNDMKDVKIYDDSGWSNQDEHVNLVLEHEYDENDEILELDSLANIIAELEIKHDCRAVFKPEHTVIYLDNNGNTHTGPFSLVPTEFDRRDVVDHDKEAYAALMVATAADIEEWEAR